MGTGERMDGKPGAEVIDGRFEVGEVIGRGAMGEVRRGRDLRLGRDVAIKHLRTDLAADAGVRARFEDEARAAARLSHHAIVTVFDSGEWEGAPYLVMECLPGATLADELGEGPLDAGRVRDIAIDIAGALDVAHRLGVIHRDVKPGNILLTESGRAKLADFGIAKSTEALDLTTTGMIIGTPAYLAPERLGGEPATVRSDLYALGVVLYEALTGEKPFGGDTPIAMAHAIHTGSPVPIGERLPGLDADLAAVIDGAMARDPDARPASAAALVAALRGEATTTSRPRTETRQATDTAILPAPAPADRRRDGGRQALVVGAVVVGALLLFLAMRGDGDGGSPPTTTVQPTVAPVAPTSSVPSDRSAPTTVPTPLDDAITELEEVVGG